MPVEMRDGSECRGVAVMNSVGMGVDDRSGRWGHVSAALLLVCREESSWPSEVTPRGATRAKPGMGEKQRSSWVSRSHAYTRGCSTGVTQHMATRIDCGAGLGG